MSSANNPDSSAIRAVVTSLYEALSFTDAIGPDFDRLTTLFAPGAHLIEVKPEGTEIIDLPTFIDRAADQLESGAMVRFDEREVWHDLASFGHIAHVLSTYEARNRAADTTPFARGVNSIQLIKDQVGWRVISLMWQNQDSTEHIPVAFLPTP